MSVDELVFVILIVLGVAFVWFAGPFIGIWAVNTLFGLNVKYSLLNWFAFLLLLCLFRTGSTSKK